jgi:hypothetical protein
MALQITKQRVRKVLRTIILCYVLLIIPSLLVYGGMLLFTDLRGKALFNGFIPVVLVLLIVYIYYLIRPFRLLGILPNLTSTDEHTDEPQSEEGYPNKMLSHSESNTLK